MTPRDELLACRGIVLRAESRFQEFREREGKALDVASVTTSQADAAALRNTLNAYVAQAKEIMRLEEILRIQVKEEERGRRGQVLQFDPIPEDPQPPPRAG